MVSTRLPGKILELIAGRPLLDHVLYRLRNLRHPVRIVVATGDAPHNDPVAVFCAERSVDCFRGSEQDVLARYYECARQCSFDQVVRLTGDNPFIDVEELNRLIDFHLVGGHEFSSSLGELPLGVGAEIFTFAALERCALKGQAPHHREHVDEYILENPTLFRCGHLAVPEYKRHPELRLTVDTPEDLRRARFIAEHATESHVTTEEAIDLCLRFA